MNKTKKSPSTTDVSEVSHVDDNIESLYQKQYEKDIKKEYKTLIKETRDLLKQGAKTFIIIGLKLQIINKRKLYIKAGFNSFKEFLDKEIDLSRQTVYKYFNLIDTFGVASLRHPEIEYSKLIPALPLFKGKILNDDKKSQLKEDLLEKCSSMSASELLEVIGEQKELYLKKNYANKVKSISSKNIDTILNKLNVSDAITEDTKIKLRELKEKICNILGE